MPSQGLQQVQRLGMQQMLSPQMQQSLQILQAPALELKSLIQQELMANPTLEEAPLEEKTAETQESDPEKIETEAENNPEEVADKELENLAQLDQEWRDYFALTGAPVRRSPEEEEKRRLFLESISRPETLQEHLLSQLQLVELGEEQRVLCETLIGNLDERGFLVASPEELAAWKNSSSNVFDATLQVVQSLDPLGVGARNVRECLQIQLQRLGHPPHSLVWQMVTHHLGDLAEKRHAEIAEAQKKSLQEVHRAAALIGTLDPFPGSRFAKDQNQYITPDLSVQKVDGKWVVMMNDEWLPHLRISNLYKDILGESNQTPEVKKYVRERIHAGKFLIRSIHQRQNTILRIAEEIVRIQADFFDNGRDFLKPLTMSEIAATMGVHETTVSRTLANKHIQTPHGIFEMKYFFTPGIRTANGQLLSSDMVKQVILELVSQESSEKPCSDQEIHQSLSSRGIPIARRTVAKYREELKVLPSHQRKSK